MGGSSSEQTIGYRYRLGVQIALCHGPVDRITRIRFDQKKAWMGNSTGGRINVSAPNLFGGEKREGGVSGAVDFETGERDQPVNDYLQARIGGLVTAFRGVAQVVMRRFYMGMNPYLKAPDFRLERIHTRQDGLEQWYDAKAEIRGDLLPDIVVQSDKFANADGWEFEEPLPANRLLITDGVMRFDADIDHGGIQQYASKEFDRIDRINSIRFDCRVLDANSGDALIMQIKNAAGDYWFFYDPRRDAGVDPTQRPTIGTSSNPFGSTALTVGTWYRHMVTFDHDADTYTVRITRRSDGALFGEETFGPIPGASPDVDSIRFDPGTDDFVLNRGSSTEYDNIEIRGQGYIRDMNPAHIIRECLTDPDWGMGYNEDDVDEASFASAADALYAEGMGISILWDQQATITEFLDQIIAHIDAALYVDPATGKYVLKLIRDDYSDSHLLTLDPSNVEAIEEFGQPATDELVNTVTVKYWDSKTSRGSSVTVHDTGLVQMHGQIIQQTFDFQGFTHAEVAGKVATRSLRALSQPLISCTVYVNRDFFSLRIGDAVFLNWPDYEVDNVIMRVVSIDYGDGIQNRMRLQLTQDVFYTPNLQLIRKVESEWVDTAVDPSPITLRVAMEAPYYELVRRLTQNIVDDTLVERPQAGFLLMSAGRPTDAEINAQSWIDRGADYEQGPTVDFAPYVTLASAMVQAAESEVDYSAENQIDLVEVGSYGQIDDEIVKVISLTPLTVARGVLDTVPAAHAAGASILFWGPSYPVSDEQEYTISTSALNVKLLPVTSIGVLDIDDADVDSVLFDQRAIRPYPPGKVQVNGEYFPESIDGMTLIGLTWAHRDRLQQTTEDLIEFTEGNIGPEYNTRYNLRIYNEDGMLVKEETLTGTSFDWTDETGISYLPGSQYDGANDYQTRGADLTGIVDGKTGIVSFWIGPGADGALLTVLGGGANISAGGGLFVYRSSFNLVGVRGRSAAGAIVLDLNSSITDVTVANGVRHVMISWDLTNPARRHVYVDDVDVTASTTHTNTAIDLTTGNFAIGAETDGGNKLNGGLTELFFHNTYLDLSIEANRRKFIQADGKAVASLGANGSDPLGVQPLIYAPTGDASGTGNKGSAGPFTTTGALVPVDGPAYAGSGNLNGQVRVELESERDGILSMQYHDFTIYRHGYGFNYGMFYGGNV